jgi:nicotinamide riboside kinase
MIRIAVVGPESSGKTTLAEALMTHYHGGYVSEVAREYLDGIDRPYVEDDLLEIARSLRSLHGGMGGLLEEASDASATAEQRSGKRGSRPVFFDTDPVNLVIWSREKYGRVHPEIEHLAHELRYTWRLLCRPDIPWEPDPQRENPHDRDRLFTLWEEELKARALPYTIIEGAREQRLRTAAHIVDVLIDGRRADLL